MRPNDSEENKIQSNENHETTTTTTTLREEANGEAAAPQSGGGGGVNPGDLVKIPLVEESGQTGEAEAHDSADPLELNAEPAETLSEPQGQKTSDNSEATEQRFSPHPPNKGPAPAGPAGLDPAVVDAVAAAMDAAWPKPAPGQNLTPGQELRKGLLGGRCGALTTEQLHEWGERAVRLVQGKEVKSSASGFVIEVLNRWLAKGGPPSEPEAQPAKQGHTSRNWYREIQQKDPQKLLDYKLAQQGESGGTAAAPPSKGRTSRNWALEIRKMTPDDLGVTLKPRQAK